MSWPQFINQKVANNTTTTTSSVVRVLNSLFENLNSIFTYLKGKPQLDSVILPQTYDLFYNKVNIIPHTLGRTLTGWKVVRQNAQSDLWDDQVSNPTPDIYLYLHCSADVTVLLEVF